MTFSDCRLMFAIRVSTFHDFFLFNRFFRFSISVVNQNYETYYNKNVIRLNEDSNLILYVSQALVASHSFRR